jgi:hypothetical protein
MNGAIPPDLAKLAEFLDQAETLLRQHQIPHWADWLARDAQRIRNQDFYGIEHLRSAFGGMGSLNDLHLTVRRPDNSELLTSSSEDNRFQRLLNQIRVLIGTLYDEER